VLQLIATALELPDKNQLAKMHDFTIKGGDILRYIKYTAIPVEDSEANNGIYAASHTDNTALTISFRQPVAGLQILDSDEEWKWVKPWEDEIVVNCGDSLMARTGGYVKSGLHRVHAPPSEQIHLDRFAVLFFSKYVC
jgi:isopenicillin N synthase-like dioxygenase